MFGYQLHRDAFGLACLMALAALTGSHASAQAQPTCTGFAVGCAVHWTMQTPPGADWRSGSYTGTIVEVISQWGGKNGVPNETPLTDLKSGKSFRVRMDQLNSIRCYPPEWTHIPTVTYEVMVCHFGGVGSVVSGPYSPQFVPSLKVQLSQEIVLSNGRKANMFLGGVDSFGNLALGLGTNQWAASNSTGQSTGGTGTGNTGTGAGTGNTGAGAGTGNTGTGAGTGNTGTGAGTGNTGTGTSTIPPKPPVVAVDEIGQGYGQALKVGYPSVIQARMGVQDYDTVLFNFAGGPFHAHTSSQLNLVADLLDAQGKMITRAVGGNLQFNQNLPAGTYGIIVRVMNYAGTGPYELVLGSGTGTTYRERE